ncbi:MAG: glycosyltransferase family 2 protein [Candidatus Micrarchaeia archaeon]
MIQLSIIIPTWDEEGNIENTINSIALTLEKDNLAYEILIVDDNSSDKTIEIVNKLSQKNSNIRLIRHQPPRSFGYSIRDGIQLSNGELIVIMMADLSDDPRYLKEMYFKYKEGNSVIVGSRFLKGSKVDSYPFLKMISNRLFNLAVMVGFFTNINDTSNNFKAFDSRKAKKIKLECKSFEVGAELMLKMLIKGEKITQIPVSWTDRTKGEAKFKLKNTFLKYFLLFLKMLKLKYTGE